MVYISYSCSIGLAYKFNKRLRSNKRNRLTSLEIADIRERVTVWVILSSSFWSSSLISGSKLVDLLLRIGDFAFAAQVSWCPELLRTVPSLLTSLIRLSFSGDLVLWSLGRLLPLLLPFRLKSFCLLILTASADGLPSNQSKLCPSLLLLWCPDWAPSAFLPVHSKLLYINMEQA